MMTRVLYANALLALLFLPIAPTCATSYEAVVLDMLPGSTYARALGINDSGQVVGYCQVGYQERAVLWDASGAAHDLGMVAGTYQSRATSINNRGETVVVRHVSVYRSETIVVKDEAVLRVWPDSGVSNRMFSINESGQMVGFVYDGYRNYAAWWGSEGVAELLPGDVTGVDSTVARDLNNGGWAVGCYNDYAHYAHNRACLWRSPTEMEYLLTESVVDSEARAVNDVGQIAGSAYTAAGTNEAFLWQNGEFHYLAKPDGITWANANDINNLGQIVGDFGVLIEGDFDPIYSCDAYIWENGQFQLLPSAYRYSEATAVNNNGWVIGWAGYVTDDGDQITRPMLWTPVPEPSGLLALAACIVGLAAMRRSWRP